MGSFTDQAATTTNFGGSRVFFFKIRTQPQTTK
jgi:hypothetical protein